LKIYQELLDAGIVSEGMLPKLENCFNALKKGVHEVNLGNTAMLTNENKNFTTITL
jgi:acetylglutamate kinase